MRFAVKSWSGERRSSVDVLANATSESKGHPNYHVEVVEAKIEDPLNISCSASSLPSRGKDLFKKLMCTVFSPDIMLTSLSTGARDIEKLASEVQ